MLNFIKVIKTFINWQCDVLYNYLDPFQDKFNSDTQIDPNDFPQLESNNFPKLNRKKKKFKINFAFLLPLLMLILITIYGLTVLQYEHTGRIVHHWHCLVRNPYIFNHQINLPDVWPQTDVTIIISVLNSVAIFTVLIFNQMYEYKYKIIKLDKDNSKLMLGSKGKCFFLVKNYRNF